MLCNIPPEQITSNLVVEPSRLSEKVPYKLVQIEGKGRGLVATRTLEIGELVLSEKAFLKTSSKFNVSFFSHLKPEIQAKLMNLSCPADSRLKDDNQILQMKFLQTAMQRCPVEQEVMFL